MIRIVDATTASDLIAPLPIERVAGGTRVILQAVPAAEIDIIVEGYDDGNRLVAYGQTRIVVVADSDNTATIVLRDLIPQPTATTPSPTATSTPSPTATSTPAPTATSTPSPTATSTPAAKRYSGNRP